MKTPHAILIGLSLIAAAIYFKDMPIRSALASSHDKVRGFSCVKYNTRFGEGLCFMLTDTDLIEFIPNSEQGLDFKHAWELKSGKPRKK